MRELSIFAAAREVPRRDCLVADGRAWSFEQIAARTAAALDALDGARVAPRDRIALTPRADVSSAVWLYASFELGCPVVLLHPRLTPRERALILEEATPAHVITTDAPTSTAPARETEQVSDDETLAIVYTSGSRGTPRGARLSRRAFVASEAAHAANLGWSAGDRWLLTMPPAHVGGLSILTRCLIARRCVVLSGGAFDAADTIVTMERDSVSLLSVVPTMLHRLLECDDPRWHPAPSLRAVLVGGAPFPDALREEASSRGIPVLGTYGCTEACSQVATQSLDQVGSPGSGVPLSGIEVRIEGGEIQVDGEMLMDGYIGAIEGIEPWTSDGWLRTGDFGELADDGQLVVRGRLDDRIVTGGENVAPQEVESWLQTQPGITGACVFGVSDPEWGQRVVAAIVIEPAAYDANALRAAMNAELAAHKRPKALAVLESLPLNRSGKVDRAAAVALAEGRLRSI